MFVRTYPFGEPAWTHVPHAHVLAAGRPARLVRRGGGNGVLHLVDPTRLLGRG